MAKAIENCELYAEMIKWILLRITNPDEAPEGTSFLERQYLEEGFEKVEKLYEQIGHQLEMMQFRCPPLAQDWELEKNFRGTLADEFEWIEYTRKQAKELVDVLYQQNNNERCGRVKLGLLLAEEDLTDLVAMEVRGDFRTLSQMQFEIDLPDCVFEMHGFQLVARIGDDALRFYFTGFAETAFGGCDDQFVEVMLEMYHRRQRHLASDDDVPPVDTNNNHADGPPTETK